MPRIGTHQVPARTLLLVFVDSLAIAVPLMAASAIREPQQFPHALLEPARWARIVLAIFVFGLSLYFCDVYDFRVVQQRMRLLLHMMQALGSGCLVLLLIYYFAPQASPGRGIVLIALPAIFIFLMSWRILANTANLLARGNERVLFMGTGEAGVSLVHHILKHPEYNIMVVGFLEESGQSNAIPFRVPAIIGTTENVEEIVAREKIDRVILSLRERRGSTPVRELLNLKFAGVRVEDVHSSFERLYGRIPLEHLSPSWFILSDGFNKSRVLLVAKRTMDFMVSFVMLMLMLPLIPLIAIAIYVDSGSPIFFQQTRVGLNGKEFNLVKFRSMVQDAEKGGPQWTAERDDRITRVGRVLRKTHLDEIPQLFNVFRGEMSLVGPRPERPYFCEQLAAEIPYFNLRHSIRPGVTGWAQVRFRYGSSFDDAKGKLELDLFYLKNLSFIVDLAILFETAKVVLLRRGSK